MLLLGAQRRGRRTHAAEDTRYLEDEVELGAARDLARALRGLERLGLELGK